MVKIGEVKKERFFFFLFRMATFFSVLVLFLVLLYIFVKGVGVVDFRFLFSSWSHRDITQGGIFPAILGTLFLALGVALFAIPVGVISAIYLNEYARDNLFNRVIKISIRNLAGVPSIVYGLFGLAFFVLFMNFGTSLIAASLTLACMTLPWVITTSEEALKAVPDSFREASLALGATKIGTIRNVVLPNSLGGMITGSILGISRVIGETAPIIMVGATFFISYLPTSPFDKFMALPYHLFILATQHSSPHSHEYALGTAFVLVVIVFSLNLGMFYVRYKLRREKKW